MLGLMKDGQSLTLRLEPLIPRIVFGRILYLVVHLPHPVVMTELLFNFPGYLNLLLGFCGDYLNILLLVRADLRRVLW